MLCTCLIGPHSFDIVPLGDLDPIESMRNSCSFSCRSSGWAQSISDSSPRRSKRPRPHIFRRCSTIDRAGARSVGRTLADHRAARVPALRSVSRAASWHWIPDRRGADLLCPERQRTAALSREAWRRAAYIAGPGCGGRSHAIHRRRGGRGRRRTAPGARLQRTAGRRGTPPERGAAKRGHPHCDTCGVSGGQSDVLGDPAGRRPTEPVRPVQPEDLGRTRDPERVWHRAERPDWRRRAARTGPGVALRRGPVRPSHSGMSTIAARRA